MSKKIICALLALVLLIGLMPVSAIPASAAKADKCGKDMIWKFHPDTGVLTISGNGATWDYNKPSDVPWFHLRNDIKVADFSSNLTVLGTNLFNASDYPNLHSVNIWNITNWCNVEFKGTNPLTFAHNLYYKGEIVRDLEIPSGVERVSTNAFNGAYISSLEIAPQKIQIGQNAFANCPNLSSVTLGEGIFNLRSGAFANCVSLESITLPNSLKTIGNHAFERCRNLSEVNMGSKVESIGEYAFAETAVTRMELPNSLTVLGTGAFASCNKLERIVMAASIANIEPYTFAGCTSLVKILIPTTVKSIGANAFDGCTGLKAVYTNDIAKWCNISFAPGSNPLRYARRLYEGNELVKDLVLPESVTVIKADAFKNCESLVSVTIPDFLHTIEKNAFADCSNLKTVYISRESRWEELKNKGIASGNTKLINATPVFGDKKPDPKPTIPTPVDPSGPQMDVNEKLVDMVVDTTPFIEFAKESYPGSGNYIIGYGTPANKGDQITRENARNTLREYLRAAAGQVHEAFKGRTPALEEYQRDALAAFSFKNGYDWLSGGTMKNAVLANHNGSQMLNTFCRRSSFLDEASLRSRMCEANLYLYGDYSSVVPSKFAFTKLDPNGGISSAYGSVKAYYTTDNVLIDSEYAPTRKDYEFIGWFTVPQDAQGKMITALDATTNGRTLYAHWQKHDEGMEDDGVVWGKRVNYQLPAYVAVASSKDSTGRIRLFKDPHEPTTHIATVDANAIVQISREYRDPETHILWVKVYASGWMKLSTTKEGNVKAVEPGTVKLAPLNRLTATENPGDDISNGGVGALRNGDAVAIFERATVGGVQYGLTVFKDGQTHKSEYKVGWIDLKYVDLAGSMHEEDIPQENEVPKDSPNGKSPIAKGIVVNTDKVNVRKNAYIGPNKVGTLPRGTKINIYEFTTTHGVRWCLHEKGWSSMQYIHEIEEPSAQKPEAQKPSNPGEVGTDDNKTPLAMGQAIPNVSLFVRSAPGAHNEKLGVLDSSNRFAIYQTKMYNGAQWGRMDKGWVCMTYVRLDGDITIQQPENETSKPAEKPATLGQGRVANCSTHVNVRANASAQSALQGTYPLNTVIVLLEETSHNGFDWYRTEKGWVCGTYVVKIAVPDITNPINPIVPNPGNPVAPNPGTTGMTGTIVCNNTVNVRKGAGVYNEKIGTLRNGSTVNIKGSQVVEGATWYQVDQGWVAGEYVQVGGASIGGNGANGGSGFIGGTTETTNGQYATGTIAQSGTKVRAGAGYGYKEVKTLKAGDRVTIYEQKLLDGVAWGRVSNTDWLNLAFVTLDSTGITGTGTIGTVYRCNHAINIRRAADYNSAQMATLLLGATVEILETTDKGNGEVWGRTPQGWVNMHYINVTGPLPTPPLPVPGDNPVNPAPNPNPNPVNPTPEQKPQKPVDQGIPFPIDAVTKDTVNLLMVPGIMGDYDASIAKDQNIHINKLEKADGKLFGMVEAGWIDMDKVQVAAYGVSEKSQIIWKDASTTTAVGALNEGESVQIIELGMDTAKKVWGRIDRGWIELTAISKPESYSKTFMMMGTINKLGDQAIIHVAASEDSDQIGEKLPEGKPLTVTALQRDIEGNLWAQINDGVNIGWVRNEFINIATNGKVISKTLLGYTNCDHNHAERVRNQGETINFKAINLNPLGVPMGQAGDDLWYDISSATFVPSK